MTYTEFIEAFEKQLSRELENADIQRFSVQKVNGKKDVLVIRESGADQIPVIWTKNMICISRDILWKIWPARQRLIMRILCAIQSWMKI